MELKEKKPKVSVCVVTYNQEEYIRQCLQSLVDQCTTFEFEVIIADDFSTDGTAKILLEFEEGYPEVVRLHLHKKNIGASENFRFVHRLARGEYVAHMDGDDYALPGKIQAQANYLDANSECQIIWHQMNILHVKTGALYAQQYDGEELASRRFTVDDLISNITLGLHSSKMYRRWAGYSPVDILDYDFSENVMHLHATGGYAAFLPLGVFGVYRVNIGISRSRGQIRIELYRWLMHFYCHRIGSRKVVTAKVILMVMSDLKHKSTSVTYGLKTLLKMLPNVSIFSILRCRSVHLPVSLDPSIYTVIDIARS